MSMVDKWVLYGLGTAVNMAAMILVFKKMLLMGIAPLVLIFFIFGITFIGFLLWVYISKIPIKISKSMILFLILASLFAILGNFFEVNSLKDAPNPGYTSTLKTFYIVIITLAAPFLFKSKINLSKFIGVLLVLGGLFLIII